MKAARIRHTLIISLMLSLSLTACITDDPDAVMQATMTAFVEEVQGTGITAPTEPAPTAVAADNTAATAPPPPGEETPPTVSVTSTPIPDVTYADFLPDVTLDVALFYSERWLRVDQTVAFRNTSEDTLDTVIFNVVSNATEGAFHLDVVNVGVDLMPDPDLQIESEFITLTMLQLTLPEPARPGAMVTVELGYRVLIPPVLDTAWPPIGNAGWGPDILQAGEWYPAIVPYVPGEGWHTWSYHPVGDVAFYPLTNTTMTITTDDELVTVVSGGLLDHDGTVWQFEVENARGIAFLASDGFLLAEGESGGVSIRSYYLEGHQQAGQDALKVAEDSIALFTDLFGPYPYTDLAVVENAFFGGMEYSAMTTVTGWAYANYNGEPNSVLHVLLAHEIAHQWWYGAVGNDQINEAWLDESLGFYSEFLYIEHYYPEHVDWWWEARVDQFRPQGDVNASPYLYSDSPSFILWMYGRAAYFLRDLRVLMGDEAFFTFLHDYYMENRWTIVTRADYFNAITSHTEADLTPLVTRYFDAP